MHRPVNVMKRLFMRKAPATLPVKDGVIGRKSYVIFAVFLLSAGGVRAANCPWSPAFISSSAKPLAPSHFRGINSGMSIPAIIARLGAAVRDAGSGVYMLQWDVTDGRIFFVSTRSACEKPFKTGFRQSPLTSDRN